jgi:RNA polymerase sigma-70 factor (ECF subfamily)
MSDELSMSGPAPTDEGLVARMRTDRTAFAALYDRYYPRIVKYCVRRLFDRAAAEDVASEVFLKVASNVRTFPGKTESDFRRWLFRIATNAVNAHFRGTLRRRELLEQAARSGNWGRDGEFHASPVEQQLLDWPAVYQALMELEEREQTIVTLRFFADLSHEEIADVVQSSPGAVRTALSRALARLRARFNTGARPARASGESSQG